MRKLLRKSKVFCMLPWIHTHIIANGNVYPCCVSEFDIPYDNIKDKSIKDIINNDKFNKLRNNMLNDIPTKSCSKCYELDESNIPSLRKYSNQTFRKDIHRINEKISNKMKYMDIRFSNICNFKCVTCGPDYSSQHGPIQQLPKSTIDEIYEFLPYVEEVSWAGGEPLVTEEHYKILDYWIENSMRNVRLRYTTNFSNFYFKEKSILDYWNSFDDVRVSASLDGMGKFVENIRVNTNWKQIEDNRKLMMKECPNVFFEITPTISNLNIEHITDFHRNWVERGLVDKNHIRVNMLTSPTKYRIDTIENKTKIIDKLQNHIEWLENGFGKRSFENILNFFEKKT
jgi:radical SAM protein with 4Fe4S-binding SPASM domain